MTTYKIGDKVRVLDVSEIFLGGAFFCNGDETEVVELFTTATNDIVPKLRGTIRPGQLTIAPDELHAIEKVEYITGADQLGVKTGDLVRILDARRIMLSRDRFVTGDVMPVNVEHGDVHLKYSDSGRMGLYLSPSEYEFVEVVKEAPQAPAMECGQADRINALEQAVEAMKEEIAALRKPTPMPMAVPTLQSGGFSIKAPGKLAISNTQARKEAIELAKEIVAGETALTEMTVGGGTGMSYGIFVVVPKFEIDTKKRTVKVDLLGASVPSVYATGVAKCDPSDVFNEDIGKAIAILRAKEKEIPEKLLKAPNPANYAVGQRILASRTAFPTVARKEAKIVKEESDGYLTDAPNRNRHDNLTWIGAHAIARVVEDTGVEY